MQFDHKKTIKQAAHDLFPADNVKSNSVTVLAILSRVYKAGQYSVRTLPRVEIDLNIRVRGNQTYADYNAVTAKRRLILGELVEVYVPETELIGQAEVTELDDDAELVYLKVDWAGIEERAANVSDE